MSNKTLLSTITDRATASFGKPLPTSAGMPFKEWEEHWIKTAEEWRDELMAEGLTETVAKLNELIQWQKDHRIGNYSA